MSMLIDAYRFGGGGGGDPYFANVSSLLHMDGADGSTSIVDVKGISWSATDTVAISTTQFKFGGASARFPVGSGSIDSSANAAFAFGTGDFTFEGFIWFDSFAGFPTFFDTRIGASGIEMVLYYSGGLRFFANSADRITGSALSINTFYHVAISRVSGVTRMFVDGVLDGSPYTDPNNYARDQIRLGRNNVGSSGLLGYIDELRVTKGIGRYTANFTPPASPFPDF